MQLPQQGVGAARVAHQTQPGQEEDEEGGHRAKELDCHVDVGKQQRRGDGQGPQRGDQRLGNGSLFYFQDSGCFIMFYLYHVVLFLKIHVVS